MVLAVPSSGLEWTPLCRDVVCVVYRCDGKLSWSDVGVSPGRKITEKPPEFELFITPLSSDGDEHDSDFVSRNNGDPDRCIERGSTKERKIHYPFKKNYCPLGIFERKKKIVINSHCRCQTKALDYFDRKLQQRLQVPVSSLSMDNYYNNMQQWQPHRLHHHPPN